MGGKNLLPAYSLRMPDDLRSELEREASVHGRSLNQEIILRLRASLGTAPPGDERLDRVESALESIKSRLAALERR